jgi:hypothetical protein
MICLPADLFSFEFGTIESMYNLKKQIFFGASRASPYSIMNTLNYVDENFEENIPKYKYALTSYDLKNSKLRNFRVIFPFKKSN